MNRTLIALGTAAVLTVGMTGAAFAADHYASPSQPVPYSQLNAYMKGSASKRASILSQNTDAMAAGGAGVNSSATMPGAQPMPMPTAGGATANGQTNMPMPNAATGPSSTEVTQPTTGANPVPAPDTTSPAPASCSPTNPTTPQ